jgi:hypothetical protein
MKFIQLPSGLIINMNQVAYIAPQEDGGRLVCFAAAAENQGRANVVHLNLEKPDAEALLRWLASMGGMIKIA